VRSLGGQCEFVVTDVSQREQVMAAVETAGGRDRRLDILVNDAISLSPNVLLEHKTDFMLDSVLKVGLWATWWAMQAAFPIMRDGGGGRVINLYSIDAEAAAWLHADYNVTKEAIKGLTRSAAMEWARHGILVNALAPVAKGTVYGNLVAANPGFEDALDQMVPLGYVGDPEADIAPVALFLAGDDGRYVTGEVIHVDGGMHLPRYQSRPADLAALSGGGAE
jgi:NAD(P)-dependent dehydrogenase (short-subunit alcohol dehydrogenase family)